MIDIRTRGDELLHNLRVLHARSTCEWRVAIRVHCIDVGACATEQVDHGSVWVLHRCVQRPAVNEVANSAAEVDARGIGVRPRLDQHLRDRWVTISRRVEDGWKWKPDLPAYVRVHWQLQQSLHLH